MSSKNQCNKENEINSGKAQEIIKLENICKTFSTKGGKVEALKDINLNIAEGDIFGIIGLSGAGKSTLVRTINLLEKPTSGRVIFGGKDLTSLKPAELNKERRDISMIFQQFNLLMQRTALENICFPLEIAGVSKSDAVKRAKELLSIVGLEDRANSYPAQLSGGQKQRVAIARALATKPKVLLCDEATSALDPKTTKAILSLLGEINKKFGITVIIITHEMNVIQEICHSVAIIDKGVVSESGAVSEIFLSPKSDAAKRLVLPGGNKTGKFSGKRLIRIVFNGRSAYEPIISNMVLACQAPVNIMYANTQNIDGQSVGQMVLQLPANDMNAEKQIAYLKDQGVVFEEIEEVGADV